MAPFRIFVVFALLLTGCGRARAPEAAQQEVQTRIIELSNGPLRKLPTLVYQPVTAGRWPVVLFIHGFTRRPEDHVLLFTQLAEAGFLVVAPTMSRTARGSQPLDVEDLVNQPADASAVLTQVLALAERKEDPLFGRIDSARIAAAGHSLGGMTTVGLFTKFRDDRLKAGVVYAGSAHAVGTDYRGAPAPLFFVHGRADTVVTFDDGKAAHDPAPGPKAFLDLPYGNHLGPFLGSSPEFDTVAAATLDFLRWSLLGDAQARERLAGTENLTLAG